PYRKRLGASEGRTASHCLERHSTGWKPYWPTVLNHRSRHTVRQQNAQLRGLYHGFTRLARPCVGPERRSGRMVEEPASQEKTEARVFRREPRRLIVVLMAVTL